MHSLRKSGIGSELAGWVTCGSSSSPCHSSPAMCHMGLEGFGFTSVDGILVGLELGYAR